jgi:S1-C subfamily serine protease
VKKIQFSAPMLPGNSGGPLISTATGEVVGQVVGVWVAGGIPTPMSYANPAEFLYENIRNTPACGKK